MGQLALFEVFAMFGLAGVLGLLIGLERQMQAGDNPHAGLRDFVLFALIGAVTAFTADHYSNPWLVVAGFAGFLALLLAGFWADRAQSAATELGITTEAAAILTFFIGVLVVQGAEALAIALAIVTLAILSQKEALTGFSAQVKRFELEATLKLLVISFVVLPILPQAPLSTLVLYPIGEVSEWNPAAAELEFRPPEEQVFEVDQSLAVYDADAELLAMLTVGEVEPGRVTATVAGEVSADLAAGTPLQASLAPRFAVSMLGALKPFKIWLIVVLVSSISFVGYVLIKVMGRGAGIGLTGLIGGLASSTVTTLSFAKRSKECPQWNRNFAVAVLLASSVMFPRLLVQIGVFNQALMRNIALPILVTGATGLLIAAFFYLRREASDVGENEEVSFDNPFSLKSAVIFGLVFASVLMVTRLAIAYLGDAWLPLVAIVSGLTDADAIAFSLSDAQRAGLISLDWASFNLVLGALSNTFMKLFLVFSLGHRGLFKRLLWAVLIMGTTGIVTTVFYYDFA